MSTLTDVRDRLREQGFRIGPATRDSRLAGSDFDDVRPVVREALSFPFSSDSRRARLSVWETSSPDDSLSVASAFNSHLDRAGSDTDRFQIYGSVYILLDRAEGWADPQEISSFLQALIA